jgi:3-deoxy-D-manno-octulosonic-acid transferase
MFIIYDLIFLVIGIIYLPIYLLRKKMHRGFFASLGFLPKGLTLDRPIWIHAVSVGEVRAIESLLEGLKKNYPDKRFVISTVTATGNKIAKGLACDKDFITYLPLDLSFIIGSVIDRINPSIFIIAETEIWPNLITSLYRKKVPLITVNGRISDNSFRGYLTIKFLLRPVLAKVNLFCMQTQLDAERLIRLGVSKDKIQVTGNMKFDVKDCADYGEDYTDYRNRLCLEPEDKLLVAGSTHPQEEEVVLATYKELLNEVSHLKLLIAPRHPERSSDVAKIVSRFGFRSIFVSSLLAAHSTCIPKQLFILDTIGELAYFYQIADIVFVGGSLVKKGGHNILEPAIFSKPILFGPHMFNFRDIADLFLRNKAAVIVHNQEDLKTNIVELLNNPDKIIELGRRAKQLVLGNQGATKRNTDFIKKLLLEI